MNEIWKDIVDYEGIYQVSNLGRVKSLSRLDSSGHKRKELILKPTPNNKGYYTVVLCVNAVHKTYQVHRLVANAFIELVDGKPFVNHIDENSTNNSVSNLEWVTSKENANHGTRNERMTKKLVELKGCKVTNGIDTYDTISEAARELNICRANISANVRGLQKTAGGFHWSYV